MVGVISGRSGRAPVVYRVRRADAKSRDSSPAVNHAGRGENGIKPGMLPGRRVRWCGGARAASADSSAVCFGLLLARSHGAQRTSEGS